VSTDDRSLPWVRENGDGERLRGRLFAAACLGATMIGVLMVGVLLLYVFLDATRVFEAEAAWFGVHGVTSALVPLGVAALLARRSRALFWSAMSTTALALFATLLAGGAVIVFIHGISLLSWLALVLAVATATAVHLAHVRLRRPPATQRTLVAALAYWLALVGVPGITVDRTLAVPGTDVTIPIQVSTPELVPSLLEAIAMLPVVPTRLATVLGAVTLPAAAVAWVVVARRHADRRRATVAAALVGGAALVGAGIAGAAGTDQWATAVVGTVVALLLVVHLDRVWAGGRLAALAFPLSLVAGIGAGVILVRTTGIRSPPTWLDWGYLTAAHSQVAADAGIYPALVGSVLMMIVVALVAFPLGVGAALYLEEYAPNSGLAGSVATFIEVNIGNLAGVPSVVYGLLGLAVFIRFVGMDTGIVVVGGLTLALLILPIVIISAREAIRSVPDSDRQASYGMGATRWQTIRRVVLPQAFPGILTGSILAFGRAIGETAPLLMIGAAATVFEAPDGLYDAFSAMPRQIYSWVSYPQDAFQYGVMAAGVVTLLVVLLAMNATAIVIRNRYQKR